jgi:hypothetical protein
MTRVQAWLVNSGAAAWVILLSSVGALIFMGMDREPPFESLSYTATAARPGGIAVVSAHVRRDLRRDCAVKFSRFFIDAAGTRWEVTPLTAVTPKGLRAFDAASEDRLRIPVNVPPGAAPGTATLIVPLAYRCNAVQELFPIDVVLTYQFEVLP